MNAYKYCVVRFVPFLEQDEFANVGIIVSINSEELLYKLNHRNARACDFFSIHKATYSDFMHIFEMELQGQIARATEREKGTDHLIEVLTLPRNNLIQCSPVRFGLSPLQPQELLEDLYKTYVAPSKEQRRSREEVLEMHVREILKGLPEGKRFNMRTVDTSLFTAHFPFVRKYENSYDLIKPLNLGLGSPGKIFDHVDSLVARLQRIKTLTGYDLNVLIAYDTGAANDLPPATLDSQQMVLEELAANDEVHITKWDDSAAIRSFALNVH